MSRRGHWWGSKGPFKIPNLQPKHSTIKEETVSYCFNLIKWIPIVPNIQVISCFLVLDMPKLWRQQEWSERNALICSFTETKLILFVTCVKHVQMHDLNFTLLKKVFIREKHSSSDHPYSI